MEKNNAVKIKYLFEKNYNPKYVNGAYGGVSFTGELVVNFYYERFPLPYEIENKINENGELLDDVVVKKPSEFKIIRSIDNGIILNKESALSIYRWLGEKLLEMGVNEDELRNITDDSCTD